MSQFGLTRLPNAEALARVVARAWLDEVEQARNAGRECHVALSGGRIASALFQAVAGQARARQAQLGHVHFFWADERCVPPEDSQSNYRVARDFLFGPLQISEKRIHRIRGELLPEAAAREATATLRQLVPPVHSGLPVLDLVLLGMGEDGHVASLFPNEQPAAVSEPAVYRAVVAPKPPPHRVTLDYAVLAAARQAWVLVAGPGKEQALQESLRPDGQTPLARLLRYRTFTRLFCDSGRPQSEPGACASRRQARATA